MNPLSRIAAKRREQKAQGEAKPKAQAPAPAHLNPLARIAAKRREQKVQDEAKPKAQAPRRNRLPPANAQRNAPPEAAPESIAAEASPVALGHLAQYQAAMDATLARLAAITAMSEEDKAAKAAALADFMPFVDAYVDAGHVYPNTVAVWCCVWLLDIGDIERGLRLGLYLIGTGNQSAPAGFKRRALEPCVCQAVYDWANQKLNANESASPYLENLIAAMEQAGNWDLPPLVAGMVYAMAAKHADRAGDWAACVDLCEKGRRANPATGNGGAGVKTIYDKARRNLAKSQRPAA